MTIRDTTLDFGLVAMTSQADTVMLCPSDPTTWANATSIAVATKTGSRGAMFYAISSPPGGGRMASLASFSDGNVTANGSANYVAIGDSVTQTLFLTETLSQPQTVQSGGAFGVISLQLILGATTQPTASGLAVGSPSIDTPAFVCSGYAQVASGLTTAAPVIPLPIFTWSGPGYFNLSEPQQTGFFTCEMDVVPIVAPIDSILGFSNGAATAYASFAMAVDFDTSSHITVRNGGAYQADAVVSYSSGQSYHLRFNGNVSNHTYSVWVTPPSQAEVLIAANYAFRTEQQGILSINNIARASTDTGDLVLSHIAFNPVAAVPLTASSPMFGGTVLNSKAGLSANSLTVSSPVLGPVLLNPGSQQTVNVGDTTIEPNFDNNHANLLIAQYIDLPVGGASLQSLTMYVDTTHTAPPNDNLILGLYADDGTGTAPGALIAQTTQFVPTNGWNTAPATSTMLAGGSRCWLAFLTTDPQLAFRTVGGTVPNSRYYVYSSSPMPASFAAGSSSTANHWSFYGTFIVGPAQGVANPLTVSSPVLPRPVLNNKVSFIPSSLIVSSPNLGSGSMGGGTTNIIPADRLYQWKPGVKYTTGYPTRTTIYTTLSPSGGNDRPAIQTAINNCPLGQVVLLNPGTYTIGNDGYGQSALLMNRGITLRGSGAGITVLRKTDGGLPRSTTIVTNTIATGGPLNKRIYMPASPSLGSDVSPIVKVAETPYTCMVDGTTAVNLTADGVAGSKSITVASTSGLSVGDIVLLDEISLPSLQPVPAGYSPSGEQVYAGDHVVWNRHSPVVSGIDDPVEAMHWFARGYPSGAQDGFGSSSDTDGRLICELKEIASISGSTITFSTPLSISYRTSHYAQICRYTSLSNGGNGGAIVRNIGVESMSLVGGGYGAIMMQCAAYCWAKNVEITQWDSGTGSGGIMFANCFRCEITDSYIHTGSTPTPGGMGYCFSLGFGSADILVENCIMRDANKVATSRCSGAGSVFAYNYMDDGWISYSSDFQEIGCNASHMVGPHHVLLEGNYAFNLDSDYTHGSSQYITYFRNQAPGFRGSWTSEGSKRAAGLNAYTRWCSFVGNILGKTGSMSGWTYTDPKMGCDVNGDNCVGGVSGSFGNDHIWRIGVDETSQWDMNMEPQTMQTVIRDGNYDYLTNSQRWHNTPGGFAIPDSLYLTSKPAFFGASTWPWTNPANGTVYTLPAKARYDAGTPNTVT